MTENIKLALIVVGGLIIITWMLIGFCREILDNADKMEILRREYDTRDQTEDNTQRIDGK